MILSLLMSQHISIPIGTKNLQCAPYLLLSYLMILSPLMSQHISIPIGTTHLQYAPYLLPSFLMTLRISSNESAHLILLQAIPSNYVMVVNLSSVLKSKMFHLLYRQVPECLGIIGAPGPPKGS